MAYLLPNSFSGSLLLLLLALANYPLLLQLPPPVTAPIALQFACIFNMLPACQADISALSSFLWRMLVQIG